MTEIELIEPVTHDCVEYPAGAVIAVPDAIAAQLVACHVGKKPEAPTPKPTKTKE